MSFVRQVCAAGVVAVLVLSGCSGDDDDDTSSTTSTTESPAESSSTSTTTESTTSTSRATTTTETTDGTTPSDDSGSSCESMSNYWSTDAKTGQDGLSQDVGVIYQLDAGRHDDEECFDQLVFRLNGPASVTYSINYGDFGDERPPVQGSAYLAVAIEAQTQGGQFDPEGHSPTNVFGPVGHDVYPSSNPEGLEVVRQVRLLSEEPGQTLLAIGLSSEQPFRVGSDVTDDQVRRLIIYIAHPR